MSGLYRKRRKRAELNLVPLIDVLVMLIFFAFVTMQFRTAAALNVTLPKVETAGKSELKNSITITVGKDGALGFNGKAARLEDLKQLISSVAGVNQDTYVFIRADEETPIKNVVEVWDLCRKNGLNKIKMMSR